MLQFSWKKYVSVSFGLLALIGCQMATQNMGGAERVDVVRVDTSTQDPVPVGMGLPAKVFTEVNIAADLPTGTPDTASLALDPADVLIELPPAKFLTAFQTVSGSMTVSFSVEDRGAVDPCVNALAAADFDVAVEDDQPVSVDPPAVTVPSGVRDILLTGVFNLCTSIDATFDAQVSIDAVDVRFTSSTAANDNGNTNDNGSANGNVNGNTNINDSGDLDDDLDNDNENLNDNLSDDDGMTNANTNSNANTNTNSSNNDNANTNTNANDNTSANANGNTNINSNSSVNANTNTNSNTDSNSSADDNANSNSSGGNSGSGSGGGSGKSNSNATGAGPYDS